MAEAGGGAGESKEEKQPLEIGSSFDSDRSLPITGRQRLDTLTADMGTFIEDVANDVKDQFNKVITFINLNIPFIHSI